MADWRSDLEWSKRDFQELVWPLILKLNWCGPGELQQVEGEERKQLDILAGIDAWQVCHDKCRMRGIASRVQTMVNGSSYDTFTVRWSRPGGNETEYAKRLAAIRDPGSWLYPSLTVQAYVDAQHLLVCSMAMIRTRDLYEFIDKMGAEKFQLKTNHDSSSTFRVVAWRPGNKYAGSGPSLQEYGTDMKIYDDL